MMLRNRKQLKYSHLGCVLLIKKNKIPVRDSRLKTNTAFRPRGLEAVFH